MVYLKLTFTICELDTLTFDLAESLAGESVEGKKETKEMRIRCFFSNLKQITWKKRCNFRKFKKIKKQVKMRGRMAGRDMRTRQMRVERIHEQTTGHAAHGHRWAPCYTQLHVFLRHNVLSPTLTSTWAWSCTQTGRKETEDAASSFR